MTRGRFYDPGHPVLPYAYTVFKDGDLIRARNGASGSVEFTGADAATVIQDAINHLTSGRAVKERVALKGSFTISKAITVPGYTVLDLRAARLTLANQVNASMIQVSGDYFEIMGGVLDGNKANQTTGSVISISGRSRRFFIGNGMYITSARSHGIYMLGTAGNAVQVGEISGIDIENCTGNGILSSNYSSDHIFAQLNLGGNDGNGLGLNGSDSNVVSNSLFWNNDEGIDVFFSKDNTIVGNRSDSNTSYGIKVDATSATNIIMGNRVYLNGTQILDSSATDIVKDNIGFVTQNNVLSGTFAIDALGVKTVTIAHGLAITPAAKDCYVTVVQDTAVDDWAFNLLKVVSTDANNVTVKINVSTASLTGGATAKIGLRVGMP